MVKKNLKESRDCLILYTKINSKCIKDLDVRNETIKLLEEITEEKLVDINLSDFLLLFWWHWVWNSAL
jgi:hypothetical protein